MLILYYPPLYAESEHELLEQSAMALEEYVKVLGQFDGQVIRDAWGDVISYHTKQAWPAVGVIADACRKRDPRANTVGEFEAGARLGYDRRRYPAKARPDYSYPVSLGVMSQAQADKLMAHHEREAAGIPDVPFKELDTDEQRERALAMFRKVVADLKAEE